MTHALFGTDFLAFVRGEAPVERLADEEAGIPAGGVDTETARPPAYEESAGADRLGADAGGTSVSCGSRSTGRPTTSGSSVPDPQRPAPHPRRRPRPGREPVTVR